MSAVTIAADLRARLSIVPCTIKDAARFVRAHHRHHRPVTC